MIKTTFYVLSLAVLLTGCNRDDKLPDETDTGSNTFGMELNGQIWTPYVPSPATSIVSKDPSLYYYTSSNELIIDAQRITNNPGFIRLAGVFKKPGEYNFSYRAYSIQTDCKAKTQYSDTSLCISPYILRDSAKSKLVITKFDTVRKIVSGTFELELEDSFQKVIKITRGRFDSHYSIQN